MTSSLRLVWSDPSWQSADCTTFWGHITSADTISVHAQTESLTKAELVSHYSRNITQLVTYDSPQDHYQTTLITGIQHNLTYHAWILAVAPKLSLVLYYTGGDNRFEGYVATFIQSLAVLPISP